MSAFSQFFDKNKWEDNRHQLRFGIGACNFLGDLGGKDAIGTNDFQDLELVHTRLGAFIGYKYTLYKKLHLRTDFTWAQVSGSDDTTEEPFRRNRNLHFKSHIWELALQLEFEIPINFRKGHIYDIKGASGWKNGGSSLYISAGIAGFRYNPLAKVDGEWVELRPLRTEGQGLPNGADEYGFYSLAIPLGVSLTKRISHQVSIGFEVAYRYTFTDYIDDVSTEYYNPEDLSLFIGGSEGEIAGYLSDPSLGLAQDGLSSNVTAPGQQRGDAEDDDGYMFVMATCHVLLNDANKSRKFSARKKRYKRRGGRPKGRRIIF
ncbi:MAG: hypothetical protein HRT74_02900 [Flavobacteriales bacterium]|nr:hypothetical protein [Flavobacteriales bacterium]